MSKFWNRSVEPRRALAGAIIFVACLALGGGWARGLQVGQPLSIEAIDPRPLAEAIRVLEERHGWIVTSEDARYEHESDIEDVTLAVRKDGKSEPKIIVPKGGVLAFNTNLLEGDRLRSRTFWKLS